MKIVHAGGQTCNRFWIYSNFIADCIEKKEKIAIWVPDITICYFPNLRNSKYLIFPLYSYKIGHIIGHKKYINLLSLLFSNRYAITFFKFLINKFPNVNFKIADVQSRRSEYFLKHLDYIKSIFDPEKSIKESVNKIFEKKREQNSYIVGVHIRYGDYRTYSNGRYFYALNEYQIIMRKILRFFPEKKITFLIASNESINLSSFSDIDCFSISNSSSVKDLYGLSICDYIIGPPSTFSGWASLMGNVPLYFIEDIHAEITQSSFKLILEIWK